METIKGADPAEGWEVALWAHDTLYDKAQTSRGSWLSEDHGDRRTVTKVCGMSPRNASFRIHTSDGSIFEFRVARVER